MKVAYKRISAAKIFIKGINTQLKKSFVCFFFKNSHKILLFTGKSISKLKLAVIFKRNGCAVFSVRIITGITIFKTVDSKINIFRIFEFCMVTERLDCDCHFFSCGENLGKYFVIVKFCFHNSVSLNFNCFACFIRNI